MVVLPSSNEKKIVLVCDDSTCCLHAMKRALGKKYHVITASSGYEAISYANIYEPDVIIMDVMMYGLNGFETVKRLKKNTSTRNIPIIFLSALTDQKYRDEGKTIGAVDYMTKPFDMAKLFETIESSSQNAKCLQ